MSTKPLTVTLCVAWALSPLAALGQQSTAAKPATTKTVGVTEAKNATAPATGGAPAQLASARHTQAMPATMAHPAYYPSHPYAYDHGMGYDEAACCDDYGWGSLLWPHPRLSHWGSVEYLVWWRKGTALPPLVSTGPLNAAGATVFFGDRDYEFGPQAGGRVTLGTWLDDQECFGIGGRFFGLGDGRIDFQRTGGPNDAISRPFINPDGTQNAFDVTGVTPPGGAIDIDVQSEVYGGDALFRKRIECDCDGRLDFLFGYQFSRINEAIDIRTRTTLPPGPPAALNIFDTFDASNEFHAGVLGLQAEFDRGPYVLSVLAKVGLGNMNHTVDISGGGNPAPLQGLLAQTTNIGEHTQDDFAISPEVNLNLGYRATEHLELSVGYSMIYWSRVVRPGDQIDLVVDTTAPLVNRPAFNFDTTDFWVMGLNFGCQWSY